MSFPFRDRSSLRDRLRGKSGDELIKELRQEFNRNRKLFENPNWGSSPAGFPQATFSRNFPFDDDEDISRRRRGNFQSHLNDIVQRHPELAEQLRPWTRLERESEPEVFHEPPSYHRTQQQQEQQSHPQQQQQDREAEEQGEEPGPLRGGGSRLRNTVPDMMHEKQIDELDLDDRGQRARSAPPAPFISRVDMNQEQSRVGGEQEQGAGATRQPQVFHIPIFVEGRDEPIFPKEADQPPQPPRREEVHQPPPQPQSRAKATATATAPPPPPQQQQQSIPVPLPPPQAAQPPPPPPPPPQQQPSNDPISRVQAVHKEVDELKQKVEAFQGSSKKDKEYVYLDEMLTRNLLKLDDIETEGRDDVRSARKEAIRSIQRCISVLDSKANAKADVQQEAPSTPAEEQQPDPIPTDKPQSPAEAMDDSSAPS